MVSEPALNFEVSFPEPASRVSLRLAFSKQLE
jgi:hypothetical protein